MDDIDLTKAIPVDEEAALRQAIAEAYARRDALLNQIADEQGPEVALRALQAIQNLDDWDGGQPVGVLDAFAAGQGRVSVPPMRSIGGRLGRIKGTMLRATIS